MFLTSPLYNAQRGAKAKCHLSFPDAASRLHYPYYSTEIWRMSIYEQTRRIMPGLFVCFYRPSGSRRQVVMRVEWLQRRNASAYSARHSLPR